MSTAERKLVRRIARQVAGCGCCSAVVHWTKREDAKEPLVEPHVVVVLSVDGGAAQITITRDRWLFLRQAADRALREFDEKWPPEPTPPLPANEMRVGHPKADEEQKKETG